MAQKLVNISVNEEDLKKIDAYCMAHNLTRSKFMLESSIEKVFVEDMANGLLMINKYLRKADGGSVLGEDKELLERAVELLGGMNRA